jgi:hypothetical protein
MYPYIQGFQVLPLAGMAFTGGGGFSFYFHASFFFWWDSLEVTWKDTWVKDFEINLWLCWSITSTDHPRGISNYWIFSLNLDTQDLKDDKSNPHCRKFKWCLSKTGTNRLWLQPFEFACTREVLVGDWILSAQGHKFNQWQLMEKKHLLICH